MNIINQIKKPKPKPDFNKMTYEELINYEPYRNFMEEYVMQFGVKNWIQTMIFFAPIVLNGQCLIPNMYFDDSDEKIPLKYKAIACIALPFTFTWSILGVTLGVPYTFLTFPKELVLPRCIECGERKSRHAWEYDGGKIVCANPKCSKQTDYITIRSKILEKNQMKIKEWVEAIKTKEKEAKEAFGNKTFNGNQFSWQ
jgi:hypothetical protein